MFFRPFLLLTMKTKNHIVDKVFTGSSAGASAPGSGPGSRWFKSTLPETLEGQQKCWPSLRFHAESVDLKPGGRRTTECCPKPARPGGALFLESAGGQIHSVRNGNGQHAGRFLFVWLSPIIWLPTVPICSFLTRDWTFYFQFCVFRSKIGHFSAHPLH